MSAIGDVLGDRYRLTEPIATGGMSTVWIAWDERLRREVAIKELHPQSGLPGPEQRLVGERAMREARITARLHHPHAVPVYDIVDHGGMPCLVMQYLPSKSLAALIAQNGVLDPLEVARVGSEVASALAAAHAAGIVHRDVKPGNVLIDLEGNAKLTDFGISHARNDVTLTSTGLVTGTPAFLSPEVARGASTDARSDVFSLGATLYTAVEGRPPFGGEHGLDNPLDILHRVATGDFPPPQRSGPMTPILLAMLSVDPNQRPSMTDVADELGRIASGGGAAATRAHHVVPGLGGPGPGASPGFGSRPPAPPPRTAPVPHPPVTPRSPVPAASGRRHGRGAVVFVIVLMVVLAGGVAAYAISQLVGSSGSSQGSGPGRVTPRSSPAGPSRNSPSGPSTGDNGSGPATSPTDTSPANGTTTVSGRPTGDELVSAVSGYYALLPTDTADAWPLLTPNYQQDPGGGRADYDAFWGRMNSVTATDLAPHGYRFVTATITYTAANGTVTVERMSFRLIQDSGVLKIAGSNLLSSTTR